MLVDNEMPVEVSESVVEKVLKVIATEGMILSQTLLRLGIRKDEKIGRRYVLGLDVRSDAINHLYDNFMNLGEFDLVVDEESMEGLEGSKLYYNDDGFVLDNPNDKG